MLVCGTVPMRRALSLPKPPSSTEASALQRRHLQFVGHASGDTVVPLEMVGVDRLRCAVEGVDHPVEQPPALKFTVCRKVRLADPLARIRRLRAEKNRRVLMPPPESNVVAGPDPDPAAVGRHAAAHPCQAFEARHLVAVQQQPVGARQVEQLATLVEGRRDGGDQHRLLGVDRAAHAAVAEVPATEDVARDDLPVIAELLAAQADHVVVGIRRQRPRAPRAGAAPFFSNQGAMSSALWPLTP